MSENKFQGTTIISLKADGNLVENLTDEFNLGIPDLYIANTRDLIWTEVKWCKIPKKPTTPLDLKHFTGPQKNFLRRHDTRPGMGCCLIGTPQGWLAISPAIFPYLLQLNNNILGGLFIKEKVTFNRLKDSIKNSEIILDRINVDVV